MCVVFSDASGKYNQILLRHGSSVTYVFEYAVSVGFVGQNGTRFPSLRRFLCPGSLSWVRTIPAVRIFVQEIIGFSGCPAFFFLEIGDDEGSISPVRVPISGLPAV